MFDTVDFFLTFMRSSMAPPDAQEMTLLMVLLLTDGARKNSRLKNSGRFHVLFFRKCCLPQSCLHPANRTRSVGRPATQNLVEAL